VPLTEQWQVVPVVSERVLDGLELRPLLDHASAHCASDVIAQWAVVEVALDACALARLAAVVAEEIKALLVEHGANLGPALICVVDLWVPVHADDVCPQVGLRVNAFEDAIDVIAEEALDLSAL